MTSIRFKRDGAAAAILLAALVLSSASGAPPEPEGNYGVGIPEVFLPKYLAYRTGQLASGTPNVMQVKLGYVKGLSRSFTSMVGTAAINLQTGAFQVSLNQLTPLQTYTVWLVDRSEDEPPLPDIVSGLTTFLAIGPLANLTGLLPLNLLPLGFTVDRVVVTPGIVWGAEPLAAGTVSVFQKTFFRRLTLLNESTGAVLFNETTTAPLLYGLVPPLDFETVGGLSELRSMTSRDSSEFRVGTSSDPSERSVKLDKLISKGAELFFEETFQGNGRTCGTCHPSTNNLMIDPDFIATLPANDPLFVAEFNPALAQLERPLLMRQFGLILENVDGLTNPTTKFVMRGVPHTLGLPVSLQQDTSLTPPPAEMTGWSGDGAPGTGSLREFAIGAVTQHFTKTLARVNGQDFKLPKEKQLDAMEAFQLSLGRSTDFDLSRITFNDAAVENGKGLFINGNGDPNAGGKCSTCHANGGALATNGQNRNFNTNVEDVVHPARSLQSFPLDGGFGATPANTDGTFGNRSFNTASAVEAADTPPFFHNNVVSTLEGVLAFYTGPEFNGPRAPAARFNFNQTQQDAIVDFMRGVNTLQNIQVAQRELQEILANNGNPIQEQNKRLQTAFEETDDAIRVLNQGGLFPSAVTAITDARNLISQGQLNNNSSQRRFLIQQAIAKLQQAMDAVATFT